MLCVAIGAGVMALILRLNRIVDWFFEEAKLGVDAVRLKFGVAVLCTGLWFLWVGSKVAGICIHMVWPEVKEFEQYMKTREEVRL